MAALGGGLPAATARDVCLCALRLHRAHAVSGARPAGGEAAVLRAAQRRQPGLCVRTERPARPPAAAARTRSAGNRGLPRLGLCSRSPFDPGRGAQAAGRPFAVAAAGSATARAAAVVGRFLRQPPHWSRGRSGSRTAALAAAGGGKPDGCRRAGRCVPLGRRGQLVDRCLDGRNQRATGAHLHDRL